MGNVTGVDKAMDWTTPQAEPIAAGVYRIPLPLPMDGLRAVNVYVIESDRGLTCIDGGWAVAAARQALERSLHDIGYHPRDITSFLVTHVHRDHYSQAAAIRSEFGRAVVWLGADDRPSLESARIGEGRSAFLPRLYRAGATNVADLWAASTRDEAFPPYKEFDASTWSDPDRWLVCDTSIEAGGSSLRAVHTPGHTAGHFVFADLEAGLLFAGDHVLPSITPSIGFEAGSDDRKHRFPLGDFLSSLATVRSMPDLRLLPAHGAADSRTHTRVDELLVHHRQRLAACEDAVNSGARTAWDVAQRLPWTRRGRMLGQLDTFNAGLAILETQLHLELLGSQGRLQEQTVGGVSHFLPADKLDG